MRSGVHMMVRQLFGKPGACCCGRAPSPLPAGKRLASVRYARASSRPRRRPLLWCSASFSGRVRSGRTIANAKSWSQVARPFAIGASRERLVWLPTATWANGAPQHNNVLRFTGSHSAPSACLNRWTGGQQEVYSKKSSTVPNIIKSMILRSEIPTQLSRTKIPYN